MMSGLQFVCQLLLAKIVFGLGMVRREPKEPLTWREYVKTGSCSSLGYAMALRSQDTVVLGLQQS